MGNNKLVVKVTVLIMVCVAVILGTQVVGSKAMTLCNLSEDDLIACKPAVTKSSNPVDPSAECCTALSKADMGCLCSYKNSYMLPALGIDPDLAMQLPVKCKLTNGTATTTC